MKKILAYIFVLLALPFILTISLCISICHTIMLVMRESPEQLYNLIMYKEEVE